MGEDQEKKHRKYRVKGRPSGNRFKYKGPFGPATIGPNEAGDGTVVAGPNMPTATVPALRSVVVWDNESWEYEGWVGSKSFVASRGKLGISRASRVVSVSAPFGNYVVAKRSLEGVGWRRDDGSLLEVRGRFSVMATAEEVAMVLVVKGAGMTSDIGIWLY